MAWRIGPIRAFGTYCGPGIGRFRANGTFDFMHGPVWIDLVVPMEKLTDKLFTNKYVEDTGHSHISIQDQTVCADRCTGKYCNYFCPAGVYEWNEEQRVTLVSFGNCVECGACSIGCPYDNISCQTPRGGFGVQFKFG